MSRGGVSSPSLGPCSSPLLCGGLSEIAVKLLVLYWSIADSQCSDGLRWTARNSAIHTHASVFTQTPPIRLPRNTEQVGLAVAVVGHPHVLSPGACPWPWSSGSVRGNFRQQWCSGVPCAVPCSPLRVGPGDGTYCWNACFRLIGGRESWFLAPHVKQLPSRLLEMKNWTFFSCCSVLKC